MSNAREQITLRNTLHIALTYDEIRDIRWHTVIAEAIPAIERGWTGEELARWALGDIGPHTINAGAAIVTTLRRLADIDPPRDITPQPTHITELQAIRHQAITDSAHVDHAGWVAKIKAQR